MAEGGYSFSLLMCWSFGGVYMEILVDSEPFGQIEPKSIELRENRCLWRPIKRNDILGCKKVPTNYRNVLAGIMLLK